MITQERLKEILHYDPETGIFTWLIKTKRRPKGSIAGSLSHGYLQIKISGKTYRSHRLAWLYVNGRWPNDVIDHINHNTADNRIDNLRDVSRSMNQHNQIKAPISNKTTGLLGATFNKEKQKYHCHIVVEGKTKHIGYFPTAELAHEAYIKAKRIHQKGNTL